MLWYLGQIPFRIVLLWSIDKRTMPNRTFRGCILRRIFSFARNGPMKSTPLSVNGRDGVIRLIGKLPMVGTKWRGEALVHVTHCLKVRFASVVPVIGQYWSLMFFNNVLGPLCNILCCSNNNLVTGCFGKIIEYF